MFKNWAQPVIHPGWAIVCTVLDTLKRWSGYRLFVHSSHRAWELATEAGRGFMSREHKHPEWYA